jgi:uncharacterized protein DUF6166
MTLDQSLDNDREYIGKVGGPDRWSVYVRDGNAYRALYHHVRHSPTGFAWGYEGSGPAELARCIIADALGFDSKTPDGVLDDVVTGGLYQAFKQQKIATIPSMSPFTIKRIDVLLWLGGADAQLLERLRAPRHAPTCWGRVEKVDDPNSPQFGGTYCNRCFDELEPAATAAVLP